jgi:hypothetical protein
MRVAVATRFATARERLCDGQAIRAVTGTASITGPVSSTSSRAMARGMPYSTIGEGISGFSGRGRHLR